MEEGGISQATNNSVGNETEECETSCASNEDISKTVEEETASESLDEGDLALTIDETVVECSSMDDEPAAVVESVRTKRSSCDSEETENEELVLESDDDKSGTVAAAPSSQKANTRLDRELRNLSILNPGPLFETVPLWECGRRRTTRQQESDEPKKEIFSYDFRGKLLGQYDLCDCLVSDCPGCFVPCEKCGSAKCGFDCRTNRPYTYASVSVPGKDVCVTNPYLEAFETDKAKTPSAC